MGIGEFFKAVIKTKSEQNVAFLQQPTEVVVLNMDVSKSMDEDDWLPSRLEGAKGAAIEFVRKRAELRPEDHVGIVAFSKKARVVVKPQPLAEPEKLARKIVELSPESTTNITEGLRQAWKQFTLFQCAKRIILLSDGEHNENGERPEKLAEKMKKEGILIDTIGIAKTLSLEAEINLREMASKDKNGKPRYRHIDDAQELIKYYEKLATELVWDFGSK
jgi:Ca-activated chloride channel family protein